MAKKRQKLTKAKRQQIHDKTNGRCGYCGCELKVSEMQIDHIIPLAQNGTNHDDNLLASCRSCNHRKESANLESFREQVERFPEVLDRDSATYRNAVRFGLVIPNPQPVRFYFEKLEEQARWSK